MPAAYRGVLLPAPILPFPCQDAGMRPLAAIPLLALCAVSAFAQDAPAPALRNWFDDPFLRVRAALKHCPVPLGPLQTSAQAAHEAHYRADRGTRCWQEGRCAHPNAYLNDQAIGQAVAERFAASRRFRRASLWITVKRGWVFVEGCVSSPRDARELSSFLAPLPSVDNVVVNVMMGTRGRPPYALAAPGPGTPLAR
jgi:hypothetical protein